MGNLHISVYVTVWIMALAFCWVKRPTRKGFVIATAIVIILFLSPAVFLVGLCLVLLVWSMNLDRLAARPNPASVRFTYDFFDDNRFTGFAVETKSERWGIRSDSNSIPEGMRAAAEKAMAVNPFGVEAVIVSTEVVMERGQPVIYDHIVSAEQINRYQEKGMWDEPQPYESHISRIKTDSGMAMVPGDGMVRLPAPRGLEAQFMSQFNGPKTKRVKRK